MSDVNKRTIRSAFERGKAFIPFITCGDPSPEVTEELVYAMEEAGADLIELGIPFSDPTAEGPVIQSANVRALSGGVTTDKIFDIFIRPDVFFYEIVAQLFCLLLDRLDFRDAFAHLFHFDLLFVLDFCTFFYYFT